MSRQTAAVYLARGADQSVAEQIRICTEYAARHGMAIVESATDGANRDGDDDGFQSFVRRVAEAGIDCVIVDCLERVPGAALQNARSIETIISRGAAFLAVEDGIDTRLRSGRTNLYRALALALPHDVRQRQSLNEAVLVVCSQEPSRRAAQLTVCRDFVEALGGTVAKEVELSGSHPAMAATLDLLRSLEPSQALVVAQFNAVSRVGSELLELWQVAIERGVTLVSVRDGVWSTRPHGLAHFAAAVGRIASESVSLPSLDKFSVSMLRGFRTLSARALSARLGITKPTLYKRMRLTMDRIGGAVEGGQTSPAAISAAFGVPLEDLEFALEWHRNRGSGRRMSRQAPADHKTQ